MDVFQTSKNAVLSAVTSGFRRESLGNRKHTDYCLGWSLEEQVKHPTTHWAHAHTDGHVHTYMHTQIGEIKYNKNKKKDPEKMKIKRRLWHRSHSRNPLSNSPNLNMLNYTTYGTLEIH